MKRVNFKIVLALLAVAVLATVLAFSILADTEKVAITYIDNGESSVVYVDKGASVALPSGSADNFKGWFTKDGTLYDAGASLAINENVTFVAANGSAIAMSQSLQNNINKGNTYIKLNSDLTITDTIELKNPYLYIDLNGYKINMTSTHGFVGGDCGLIIKNGTINHTYSGSDANLVLYSLVALSPKTTNNLVLTICENTSINTNCGLLEITTDISGADGALDVNIMGAVKSDRLLRTSGILGGSVEFYDGASYETECEYFFDDQSAGKSGIYVVLTIGQADFKLDSTSGYAKDTSHYKAILLKDKKSTYSKNVSSFFPAGNYSFKKLSDTCYEFSGCTHYGPVINDPSTDCTSDVTVTHKCSYCDYEYTVRHANGKGHSYEVELTQDMINTEELTREGYYTYTCKVCGDSYRKYIFPDPRTVYVTVGVINSKGKYEELRVPSEYIFDYTLDDSTGYLTLMAFTTAFMEGSYNVKQENIVYLEIPLGTEAVYGSFRNGAGSGAFMRNEHLKKISIPLSMQVVQQYAFNSMPNLEEIVGLENISKTIANDAFEQGADSKLVIDYLTLNAETIGEEAFRNVRMKTLTFGQTVKTIQKSAFQLETHTSMLVEVIVEGILPLVDPDTNVEIPRTAKAALSSVARKSYNETNQQFASMEIFYSAHDYKTTEKPASCIEDGYKEDICTRCSAIKDNLRYDIVSALEHTYDLNATFDEATKSYDSDLIEYVPSSCRVRGYWAHKCTVCGNVDLENKTVLRTDKNVHVYTASEKVVCAGYICEVSYYTLGVCACGAVEPDVHANRTYHDPVSANGVHDWDTKNVKVVEEANCGKPGSEIQTCKICSKTKSVYVMPSGTHRYGEVEVTDPGTCQTKGTGVKVCTICGDRRETTVEGKHILEGEGEVIVEATTESKGQKQFFCTICQKQIIEEIPRLESTEKQDLETGIIVLIVIGSILLVALIGVAVFFTIFWPMIKKKRNSGFVYKFNTLGK
ncbi:MAG: leucine-rich repeat protein [Clostridia bacterium]|nr:leucine-rich repeat protein [Clostridia bacterium]